MRTRVRLLHGVWVFAPFLSSACFEKLASVGGKGDLRIGVGFCREPGFHLFLFAPICHRCNSRPALNFSRLSEHGCDLQCRVGGNWRVNLRVRTKASTVHITLSRPDYYGGRVPGCRGGAFEVCHL